MNVRLVMSALVVLSISLSSFAEVQSRWECEGIKIYPKGPPSANAGDVVTYDFRVSNEGSCDLKDVDLIDFLPRRSAYHSASPKPTSYPDGDAIEALPIPIRKIEWRDLQLPKSSALDFTVKISVKGPPGRTITNSVCLENQQTGRVCAQVDTRIKAGEIEIPEN